MPNFPNIGWMALYGQPAKALTRENTLKLPNKGAVYSIHKEKNGPPIYVGRASGNGGKYGARHRLSSYHQKDDFKEHPTKKPLRKDANYFKVIIVEDKKTRRTLENQLKKGLHGNGKLKYNHIGKL